MTHTYQISGMHCSNCTGKIEATLSQLNGVEKITVSLENNQAVISMSKPISLDTLQFHLTQLDSKYIISEFVDDKNIIPKSWLATYKPVVLIFSYLLLTTAVIELSHQNIDPLRWMRHFMAGFFLIFSFFKMINLKGFQETYRMYDIIARKFPSWAYVYAFTELILGFAFIANFNPIITNFVTLTVMTISIVGVLQTVLNKKLIQCACLGDVFNLPMSTVTIIEDGLMIVMSAFMLIMELI